MTENKQTTAEGWLTLQSILRTVTTINGEPDGQPLMFVSDAIHLAKEYAAQFQTTGEPLYRWVKASERLPEKLIHIYAREIDTCIPCVDFNYWIGKYPDSVNTLEWLEELPTPSIDYEKEAEELYPTPNNKRGVFIHSVGIQRAAYIKGCQRHNTEERVVKDFKENFPLNLLDHENMK